MGTLGGGVAGRGALLSGRLAPGALDVARVWGSACPANSSAAQGKGSSHGRLEHGWSRGALGPCAPPFGLRILLLA